jgi:hypothetical protein
VGPRLAVDAAGRRLLDAVVAHRGGGVEAVRDVGLRDALDQRGVDRVRRPHPGEAVGLQLEPHRSRRRALPIVPDLLVVPQQVLHVVAVLVGQHVRLGEVSAVGAEARAQLVVEPEVEVRPLVGGAVGQ